MKNSENSILEYPEAELEEWIARAEAENQTHELVNIFK